MIKTKFRKFSVPSRKKRRTSIKRKNKPSLKAEILAALVSHFQWSLVGQAAFWEPEIIRNTLQEIVNDDELWNTVVSLSEVCQKMKKIKERR